eukprot:13451027-Alexandrium_andersonii.AAC.1
MAETGIFTLRGAQRAIRKPPNSRQCCNPSQFAICPAENATSLQAFEPGTARAQERHQIGPESCRGVHSAPLFAQIPNLPTKA